MSLFGKIAKGLIGVAKVGLGVVTHGVSDKVLGALKALNLQKKQNYAETGAAQALALKHAPQTKSTATYARDTLIRATRGGGSTGDSRSRTTVDASPGQSGAVGRDTRATRRTTRRRKPQRRAAGPARPVARKAATNRAAPARTKRVAPASFAKFAQRSKELAAQWRAAGGKEGTGQTFFEWKRGK